jgi:hypothetical protein
MFNYSVFMKSQLILLTIACSIGIAGCVSTQAQQNTQSVSSAATLDSSTASTQIATSPSIEPENSTANISKSSIDSANGDRCTGNNNHLFLGNGTSKNKYGNPIYSLNLCVGGQNVKNYQIVSGRGFTQQRNRHQSGTHAPLPNGKYRLSNGLFQGTLVEVGKVDGLNVSQPFLAISPLFRTGRSALGFHVDPSFNKDPKEDGTSGCIGFITAADFKSFWADIKRYQLKDLQVAINTRAVDNPTVAEQP